MNSRTSWVVIAIASTAAFVHACSADDAATNVVAGKDPGTLGGPCLSNGTCLAGLSCVSKLCVAADGGVGGSAGDSSVGGAAGAAGTGKGGAAGAGNGGASGTGATGGMAGGAGAGGSAGTQDAGGSDGQAGSGGKPPPEISTITLDHRFVPNKMFGGWGPHLGHLVRASASSGAGESLWFVDDVCSQSAGPTQCDVLSDMNLGIFEKVGASWQSKGVVTLPGSIQQNTATIASKDGKSLYTYGLDVSSHGITECTYAPASGPQGCKDLTFTLLPSSNYIGAAISPQGFRMVWWTTVQDGGGGTFHYIVDYGGGWNGPRSGDAAGYNDASYINIAFGTGAYANLFTMHVQLVSGTAPNWGFLGAVGYGNFSNANPVSWANALAAPASDAVMSTNDVWTDPDTNDTHLVARTDSGAAVYYHRPAGGAWSAPLFTLPSTYRARFVFSEDRLVLVYGPSAGGLAYRVAAKTDRAAGSPISWDALAETAVDLPSGFGNVVAIYPESPAYQVAAAHGINVALVGNTEQNRALYVGLEP